MQNSNLYSILVLTGIILAALIIIGIIIARLYKRSSKEVSFVRTGFGGEKVILGGGAIVLPVLHEVIPVNMNTLRLEVKRATDQALITKDRMRVDVAAEFTFVLNQQLNRLQLRLKHLVKKPCNPMN